MIFCSTLLDRRASGLRRAWWPPSTPTPPLRRPWMASLPRQCSCIGHSQNVGLSIPKGLSNCFMESYPLVSARGQSANPYWCRLKRFFRRECPTGMSSEVAKSVCSQIIVFWGAPSWVVFPMFSRSFLTKLYHSWWRLLQNWLSALDVHSGPWLLSSCLIDRGGNVVALCMYTWSSVSLWFCTNIRSKECICTQ